MNRDFGSLFSLLAERLKISNEDNLLEEKKSSLIILIPFIDRSRYFEIRNGLEN